jgi:cytochrome b561
MVRMKNSAARYGGVAQVLHWLIAVLIVVQFVLAKLAEAAGDARAAHPAAALEQLAWLARHKSVGLTIFALALVRLAWRWYSPPPPSPAAMPRWQVIVAKSTHFGFYALLLLLPMSGVVMSDAANFPVSYFGWFTLPNFVAPDDSLKRVMEQRHEMLFDALAVLAGLHILAAVKHHLVDRDDVLRGMLPWSRQ